MAYRAFLPAQLSTQWSSFVLRRLGTLTDSDCNQFDAPDLTPTFSILRDVDNFLRISWARTIGNGWCSSYRMHEPVKLPCIFGCVGERDLLPHYLNCPILLGLTSEELLCTFGPTVLHRLCIREPSRQSFVMLAAIHGIYHYIKQGNRPLVDRTFSRCGPRMAPIIKLASQKAREYRVQYSRLLFCPDQADPLEQESAWDLLDPPDLGGHSFSDGVGSLPSEGAFVRATDPNAHNPLIATATTDFSHHATPRAGLLQASASRSSTTLPAFAYLGAGVGVGAGVNLGAGVNRSSTNFYGSSALNRDTTPLAPGVSPRRACVSTFVPAAHANAHNPFIHASARLGSGPTGSSADNSSRESFAGPVSVSPDNR